MTQNAITGMALLGIWGALLLLAVAGANAAHTLKRREFWRRIMAGLVGLSDYHHRRSR